VNRVAERVVLICLFALCGFMAYVAWGYSLRDALGPGAGFFPFWLGVLGMAMCVALLANSWRGIGPAGGAEPLLPSREAAPRMAALVGALVVAALILEPLGFRLTMLLFTAGLLVALGVRRPVPIALFALACSFGLYHVFFHWLKVPLPDGMLGF
jgi:putative tricarboxylic transport membrane protein